MLDYLLDLFRTMFARAIIGAPISSAHPYSQITALEYAIFDVIPPIVVVMG